MPAHKCQCAYTDKRRFCISHIRLFERLPMALQGQLVARSVHSVHPRGSALVREGDPIDSVLIIQRGKVKIASTDASGEEHILDVLHDGQAIWHGIFLKDHIYHYDVICLEPVTLCEIPRDALTEVLERPASNIYVVQGEREHLIPAVPEFIRGVDVENGLVTVHLIEGM